MRLTTITLLHTVGNTKCKTILSLFGDNQVTMTSIKKESVTLDFSIYHSSLHLRPKQRSGHVMGVTFSQWLLI